MRSGASAQASPIASRSSSEIASTMTSRSPRAGGVVERLARAPHRRGCTTAHGTSPTGCLRLAGEPAAQVRVGHRVERMVLEAGFVEEPVADEEMALVDGAAGGREGRAGDDAVDPERARQRLADRADIALAASNRRSSSI